MLLLSYWLDGAHGEPLLPVPSAHCLDVVPNLSPNCPS